MAIKLVYCVRRRDDIEPDEFYRYWLEQHGPLVKSLARDIGATRYVQSHTVMPEMNEELMASRGLPEPYDGITEVWWNNLEDLGGKNGAEAATQAALRLIEDESTFIDFSGSRVFMTEEHEIFQGL